MRQVESEKDRNNVATKKQQDEAIATAMRGQRDAKASRATAGPKVVIKSKAGPTSIDDARSAKAARASAPVAKAGATSKAGSTSASRGRPASSTSQAEKVRQALIASPEARPADIARETGVDPAYVWDIRKVMYAKGTLKAPAATTSTAKASKKDATPTPVASKAKALPKASAVATPPASVKVTTSSRVPKAVKAATSAGPTVKKVATRK